MTGFFTNTVPAELLKNKRSKIAWVSFLAFALAPVMGGVFMMIMSDTHALSKAGGLSVKMQMMNLDADWNAYLGILNQAIGVGGVLIFGFVASWVFGREYTDGTAKDLLALPTSRTTTLNAKFVVYILWCLALAVSNLVIGFIIGLLLHLPMPGISVVARNLSDYFITAAQIICIGTPVAFFAMWGRGYLAPLGFVALTLVFAQVIAATGYGSYFPWSIPGLYSGAGGEYKAGLDAVSYGMLALTGITGYLLTIGYWKYADQSK